MEHGSIERAIHVDASPEVVYEVISNPGTYGGGGLTRQISSPRPVPPVHSSGRTRPPARHTSSR